MVLRSYPSFCGVGLLSRSAAFIVRFLGGAALLLLFLQGVAVSPHPVLFFFLLLGGGAVVPFQNSNLTVNSEEHSWKNMNKKTKTQMTK